MPRPVEALPCGSRSMIRTSSPMAASAVPRLIAVVVLPTPPFWLATARTRGGLAGPACASRWGVEKATTPGALGALGVCSEDDVSLTRFDLSCGSRSLAGIPLHARVKRRFKPTHDDDSGLRISPTRHQTCLNLPTFSSFGQFTRNILSLGKEPVRS